MNCLFLPNLFSVSSHNRISISIRIRIPICINMIFSFISKLFSTILYHMNNLTLSFRFHRQLLVDARYQIISQLFWTFVTVIY